MTDVEKAKAFAHLPALKQAMVKAGVSSSPLFTYHDVIRQEDVPVEMNERVSVSHRVKDFDAWLKAYDAEGKTTRAANGLVDRALSRGVDDPNMVYIVFAVSDMAKAKARLNSPDLKKIMTDAGVEGPPVIHFYRIVN